MFIKFIHFTLLIHFVGEHVKSSFYYPRMDLTSTVKWCFLSQKETRRNLAEKLAMIPQTSVDRVYFLARFTIITIQARVIINRV